jgi:uncharacterized protein YjiK
MTNSKGPSVQGFSLTYLDRFTIGDKAAGLTEPSGLALSLGRKALWVVSDDTKRIFKLGLDGELKKDSTFKIADKGLEGITLEPTGEHLLTVREDDDEIIRVAIDKQQVTDRHRLADMAGYDAVAPYFDDVGSNKGLEGIAWNSDTGTVFVVKERDPGLLVEVSPDLQAIQSHRLLNDENGFRDTEVTADRLDFSDICYDGSRGCFWIISDKASRLFLYDWKGDRVVQSARLGYARKGKYRDIVKPEGVAVDPDAGRLYVVSDQKAQLYVFDIRE